MLALLQAAPAAATTSNLLWPTVAVVVVVAVIGALVRRLSRDSCVRMLHGHHATLLFEERLTVWGDLVVRSQGVEVLFDALVQGPDGLVKSSQLLYDDELASCIAMCRVDVALTADERREREKQVRRTFQPGPLRRGVRSLRNLANILRDAVSTAIGLVIGRAAGGGFVGAAVRSKSTEVNAIGGRITELVTNAYEPLLEQHVGRAVVLELRAGKDPQKSPIVEIPGYLVEYTAKHVAVFNVSHPRGESVMLSLPADPEEAAKHGIRVDADAQGMKLTVLGTGALVVAKALLPERTLDLDVVLLPGTSLRMPPWERPFMLELHRVHGIDVVCPRSRARVRNGSEPAAIPRPGWNGSGPVLTT